MSEISIHLRDYDSSTGQVVKEHEELTVRLVEDYTRSQWPECRCPVHLHVNQATGEEEGTVLNLSGVHLVRPSTA